MCLYFSILYNERICRIILAAIIQTGGASVTGVFLLTVERYLAVKHPTFSRQFLTRKKVIKTIIYTWIFWTLYSGLGLAVSWNQHPNPLYNSNKICTLGGGYQNGYHLMSIVILFSLHQVPMWYFQINTLKVAKFYMKPAADRLKKKCSLNSLHRLDNEKSTSKESETGEIQLSNFKSLPDRRDGPSTAALLFDRSNNLEGHRRHSAPLPKRESIKSEQFLDLPRGNINRSPFASLTSVAELNLGGFRRYSSIRDAEKIKRVIRRSQQMSKLVFSVMGCFSLCWWPYMTALGVYTTCPNHCKIKPYVFNILGVFIIINSFSNAFIYAAKSKDFRSAFRSIFKCWRSSNLSLSITQSFPRLSCEHIK